MSRIAKAKPCPFCNEDDSFVECMDFGAFAVVCNGCGAKGPGAEGDGCDDTAENFAGRRNAVRSWNARKRTVRVRAFLTKEMFHGASSLSADTGSRED